MATAAPRQRRVRDPQERTRRAWNAYREGLRGLVGVEYERAEGAAWAHLQEELSLVADPPARDEPRSDAID